MIETFIVLSAGSARASTSTSDINTFISVTIAFDGTELVWDHHEDGYEAVGGTSTQGSSEVWGDGNCDNGFRPDIGDLADCTAEKDILEAGDAVVINNVVPLPRTSDIYYDGGDKISASAPIKLVRGGFSVTSTQYLAGAVEIYESSEWETEYVAPVGENTIVGFNQPFERVELFVMAKEDGTSVSYPGNTVTLNQGGSVRITGVLEGYAITADKPVQVDLLAGDPGSTGPNAFYELRWYAILPRTDWANDYYSPVGIKESDRSSKVWLYNPNEFPITVNVVTFSEIPYNVTVGAGTTASTNAIPTGSGVHVYTGNDGSNPDGPQFFALTQTDVDETPGDTSDGTGTASDWGKLTVSFRKDGALRKFVELFTGIKLVSSCISFFLSHFCHLYFFST